MMITGDQAARVVYGSRALELNIEQIRTKNIGFKAIEYKAFKSPSNCLKVSRNENRHFCRVSRREKLWGPALVRLQGGNRPRLLTQNWLLNQVVISKE